MLKAARALAARRPGLALGAFDLDKRLPVAAGLGGGSSDAAAALRLLAEANGIALDDARCSRRRAPPAPMCRSASIRARASCAVSANVLSAPLALPPLPAVLVNPGVALADQGGLRRLEGFASGCGRTRRSGARSSPSARDCRTACGRTDATTWSRLPSRCSRRSRDVLAALRERPGCALARMSGSGATCFGLFGTPDEAAAAEKALSVKQPTWWVKATTLGGR